jgi:hypothetical protein
MDPKTIGNYGGPKLDGLPVSNPETQVAASDMNRYMEDLAQATRTVLRAAVTFTSAGAVDPVPPAAVFHRSVWGSGAAQKPVVNRTGAGLYTITYASTFTDPLGVIETVAFFAGHASVQVTGAGTDDWDAKITSIASNIVTIALRDALVPTDIVTPVTVWLL